uniref:hypothetical protein n=1 Tax=Enterocloster clostridioformis TaxID=1531 RepID=UPI003FA4A240
LKVYIILISHPFVDIIFLRKPNHIKYGNDSILFTPFIPSPAFDKAFSHSVSLSNPFPQVHITSRTGIMLFPFSVNPFLIFRP